MDKLICKSERAVSCGLRASIEANT
uniref:Uncharacterized protein n=1 Tax=Oryza punctata TaxID=4537 RepID=A0A0E0LSR1_ORYPU